MRITESALRQIIREEILNEVPLDFAGNYEVPPDEGDSWTYTRSARKAIGQARKLYTDRGDNIPHDYK